MGWSQGICILNKLLRVSVPTLKSESHSLGGLSLAREFILQNPCPWLLLPPIVQLVHPNLVSLSAVTHVKYLIISIIVPDALFVISFVAHRLFLRLSGFILLSSKFCPSTLTSFGLSS